jgi:predicted glycosyltransferase
VLLGFYIKCSSILSSYGGAVVIPSMSDVQEIWERAERLYALALKARDDNLVEYALQLEQLAAEASAHAERLAAEFQEPKDQTRGGKASPG